MKYQEIVNKSKEELAKMAHELRAQLSQLHFDLPDKKVKDLSQFKKIKRNIARILTAMNNN